MPGASSIGLLRANRPFRALWCSRSASFLGDAMSLVALLLHVAEGRGEAVAVAALLLVGDLVPSFLGPLTGTVADRVDLRRLLRWCEVVQGLLLVVIALTLPPLPVLLALVAVRALAGQVFQAGSRAAVPALVDDGELERANAAVGFGANGMEALGPLLAAALLPLVGLRGVLLADAATFALSAALLGGLPALPAAVVDVPASFLADARHGLRHLWAARRVRVVALGFVAVVACTGVDDVALVFLATDVLGGSSAVTAALYAAVGIGLLLGFGLLARGPVLPLAVGGLALSSAGNLLTGLSWAVGAAFAFQVVRGLGNAAIDIGMSTLIQRDVPAGARGRAFGTVYGAVGVAAGASYLLGAVLLELTSPRTTLVAAGAGGLAATVATATALRR